MSVFDEMFKPTTANKVGIVGLTDELKVLYIKSYLDCSGNSIVVVAPSLSEANKIFNYLNTHIENILFFPIDDFFVNDVIVASPELKITRLETLKIGLENKPEVVVTNLAGLLYNISNKDTWRRKSVELYVNQEIDPSIIIKQLYDTGYRRVAIVEDPGEMAIRGYLVDVFPLGMEQPFRIEFFGNLIESIRSFNATTQMSIKKYDKVLIYPFKEGFAEEGNFIFPQTKECSCLLDFLKSPILIYHDYPNIRKMYKTLGGNITAADFSKIDLLTNGKCAKTIYLPGVDNIITDINLDEEVTFEASTIAEFGGDFALINKYIKKEQAQGATIIIALRTEQKVKNVGAYIDAETFITTEEKIIPNKINIIKKHLNEGFKFEQWVVLTEKELLNKKQFKPRRTTLFKERVKISDLKKISKGDYIVHNIHGIGIYQGIVTLRKGEIKRDYIRVDYRGQDKLYIPTEKTELLSKFSAREGYKPKIDKLGGLTWARTKAKIQNRIKDVAKKILTMAAERKINMGFAFKPDDKVQAQFESDFMFEATKDQLEATEQIKRDMESMQPMDRILCGDVGFGKTEVAFRAAFKAITNFKQVAYLCPTTILSKQQYTSALERFDDYPINISLLNRFTTKKEEVQILEGLETGKIDIIFGTHKLLYGKIKFKNLGLLIIDEEQRFGVIQKEKIKELRKEIDVLTLSATPIPRTLQMSILGLKKLSLITTPPLNRFPVQTYVLAYNESVIKEAVYKELARNGQVLILYNRVENITAVEKNITQLIPEASVTYAHGKMSKRALEDRMVAFINKEYNVLICTTIIETGIDIPNCNTLIIIGADKFGLSQLYQIRGRVGRSDRIAYAYLMYSNKKVLSQKAAERLEAIKNFTELGSGLTIASKDLAIRGAGDILGQEQAGFIDAIGIELYLKMLDEEIKKLKGMASKTEEIINDKPVIEVDTHIDDSYIPDEEVKIEIHKKINEIDSYQKLTEICGEIQDRFGKIPENLLIYMYQEWFEKLARKMGVEKLRKRGNYIDIILKKGSVITEENLSSLQEETPVFCYYDNHKRLIIRIDASNTGKHFVYHATSVLNKINEEIKQNVN
ncbi:MAG: transcription-repair coupling factor [Bacilli bacterium]|nr:transcription-repair coupling factor [Bacilli bacterium]